MNDPTNPSGPDRRLSQRIDVRLPVIFRCDGRLIPATALNISCGGMLLSAETADLVTSANVEVIFDLSEVERDVTLRGEVVRVGEGEATSHVGVRFTNLFAIGHQALQRYLRRLGLQ